MKEQKHITDLDDEDAVLVWADVLQQRGDPRGELIALCHAGADLKPHLRAHPELAPYGEATWRLGYVDRITLDHPTKASASSVLRHDSCRFVREIRVECALTRSAQAFAGIGARTRPTVKTLSISQDYYGYGEPFEHDHAISDRVWGALPALTKLVLDPGWDLFDRITHSTIEEIVVRDGQPFCPRGQPRAWEMPALRAVTWHYRTQSHEQGVVARPADFMALWTANAPNLVELDFAGAALYTSANDPGLFEYERFLMLLERLEVLRLPYQAIASEPQQFVQMIRTHASRLAHLREFGVTTIARVDEAKMQKLVPGFAWIPSPWY